MDCCKLDWNEKYFRLLRQWKNFLVIIYSWPFMRRVKYLYQREPPSYGPFMQKMSSSISEWDLGDVETLAKEGELKKEECRNQPLPPSTRQNKLTCKALQTKTTRRRNYSTSAKSLSTMDYLLDFLGIPSLNGDALEIW